MLPQFKTPILVTGTFTPGGIQDVNIVSSIVLAISAASLPLPTGAATEATLLAAKLDLDKFTFLSTRLLVDGSGVIQPISGSVSVSNFPVTQAVTQSTIPWIVNGSGFTQPVSGPLTDAQLRATPVPVSGSITTSPNVNVHDGTGISISSTGSSLNVDVTNTVPITGTITANQGTPNSPANKWPIEIVDSAGVNIATVDATGDLQVDVNNFPATQNVNITGSITLPISTVSLPLPTGAATEATLLAAKIDLDKFTFTATRLLIDGSGVTQPISAVSLPLPTGAATAANQATANTSLASIDSKLTAPLSTTETQKTTGLLRSGEVATAATTVAFVRKTNLNNTITTDTALTISSTSVNDTLAGTGAQKVKVTYYLQTGSGPFTTTASMNGTTIVFLPAMSFVERMEVVQVGSGGKSAGQIFITLLAPLTQIALINTGESESYWCHHFVPLGKTCYITGFSYSHTGTAAANGGIFILTKQNVPFANQPITQTFGPFHLQGTDGTQEVEFLTPVIVTGPAYLVATITPDASTANSYFAAMDFYDL